MYYIVCSILHIYYTTHTILHIYTHILNAYTTLIYFTHTILYTLHILIYIGFYDVIPEPLLSVFDFQEIELLLHGLPNIEMDDWIANVEYTGRCTVCDEYYSILVMRVYM